MRVQSCVCVTVGVFVCVRACVRACDVNIFVINTMSLCYSIINVTFQNSFNNSYGANVDYCIFALMALFKWKQKQHVAGIHLCQFIETNSSQPESRHYLKRYTLNNKLSDNMTVDI